MKLSIIIPAYNEEKNIEKTLTAISRFLSENKVDFEIIVVANNCTDNTVPVLYGVKKNTISELVVIDIPKTGMVGNTKGYAIGVGMREAKGEYHLFLDADNATSFDCIGQFMDYIKQGYDVVVASRYVSGSRILQQPVRRVVLSRLSNILIRAVLLPGIYDTQCGFKMFTRAASKEIFSRTTVNGWGADLEMLAIAKNFGFKIKEAPVVWEYQAGSRVRAGGILNTLKELFKIRKNVKNNFYQRN